MMFIKGDFHRVFYHDRGSFVVNVNSYELRRKFPTLFRWYKRLFISRYIVHFAESSP